MTDQDRNIRTLITCFVIALVALVPLRIVESQNLMTQDAMVLGEETEMIEEEVFEEIYQEDGGYVLEEEIYKEEMVFDEETYNEEESYVGKMVLREETEIIEEEVVEEEIVLPNAELK